MGVFIPCVFRLRKQVWDWNLSVFGGNVDTYLGEVLSPPPRSILFLPEAFLFPSATPGLASLITAPRGHHAGTARDQRLQQAPALAHSLDSEALVPIPNLRPGQGRKSFGCEDVTGSVFEEYSCQLCTAEAGRKQLRELPLLFAAHLLRYSYDHTRTDPRYKPRIAGRIHVA